MRKIICLIMGIIISGLLGFVLIVPYVEAKKNLQPYSRDRDLFLLNYYGNMRFLLADVGITSETFIQETLRKRQEIFYRSVSQQKSEDLIIPYADYFYYIMPHEKDNALDIRKNKNRELFLHAVAVVERYVSGSPQLPFIKYKAFEQLARTYNFINRFGVNSFTDIETNVALSENAWRGFNNLSKDFDLSDEDNISLFTVFYWNLAQNSAETLLNIAKTQSVCSHSFLPTYLEIRASFYPNSHHLFQLLVRDRVFPEGTDIKSAIKSKTNIKADELIKNNCKVEMNMHEHDAFKIRPR